MLLINEKNKRKIASIAGIPSSSKASGIPTTKRIINTGKMKRNRMKKGSVRCGKKRK